MCMGVLHLHSKGVIHRDIKPMNLLLKSNTSSDNSAPVLKLGDMSESRVLDHQSYIQTKKIIGTPLSLAPEVVSKEGYD
jgi:serine/threonine protein kinase